MDSSLYKSVKTARGYDYSYYVSSLKGSKETLLFLHGFPEYADMWADQIKHFEAQGHTCIAPDLLGYGNTSKPVGGEPYNSEGLSQDLVDILDTENFDKIIVIGHDWGSYLAGRFVNWFPARALGLVATSVAYRPPAKLDLDAANAQLKAALGYEPFGYWDWIASEEAPVVLEEHIDSFFSLLFAKDSEIWKTDFTPTGKLQEWLEADRRVEQADFVSVGDRDDFTAKWRQDGFVGKLGWYKAMTENANWEHEQRLSPEALKLVVPVLFIGGSRDAPAPADLGDLVTKPLCQDYTGHVVDSAHWMLREQPKQWQEIVENWLTTKF